MASAFEKWFHGNLASLRNGVRVEYLSRQAWDAALEEAKKAALRYKFADNGGDVDAIVAAIGELKEQK
jgi:hypothetical protein